MKKRLLSLLLALCMALSLVPVGAFAAYDTSNNITDITFSADGVPTKTSGTGWTYKNNTLEIKSGFSFANNADYPLIKCNVNNYGTIMGGVYNGKVTNYGTISFGIFAQKPENEGSGTGTYYKISSSTGEELTFNSKLTANQAYTLATQAVKLTAPAGKVFSDGKSTYSIDFFSKDIVVTLSDPTRIDLTIGNDGYPVNSNGGTQPVYNGNGWTYQMTTLESGINEMALVIDEGTDTAALKNKVIRVPVKCAGTLKGGLYTKSVELSGNGKITGGFFTNDVKNANLSSVAIEHGDTFTVDSFPSVTLSKVYTKASPYNTITLKLTKPQQLQHVGAGYYFSQPSDFSSVKLNVPEGDTVILYKRAQLLRELFKVTAPDIKVGDPVNVTVVPADGVVGLGTISIAGFYRAENSGFELLDADYVSKHADRYRVVVRVGVGTVYEGATTYSAGNVGGDNSWFFTVSAPAPTPAHTPAANDFVYNAPLHFETDQLDGLETRLKESLTKNNVIRKDDVTILYVDKDGQTLSGAPTEEGNYSFKITVKAAADGSYSATDEPLTDPSWTFTIHPASYSVYVTGGYAYTQDADGTKHYLSTEVGVYPGTKICLEVADPEAAFNGWQLGEGSAKPDAATSNLTLKDGSYFIMPGGDVKLSLAPAGSDSGNTGDNTGDSTGGGTSAAVSDDTSAGVGAALVVGGAALGGAAYLVGTQLWLEANLPADASIPTSRQQLADLLWKQAGMPEPASTALYPDISAADSQKAARWCAEQGLLKDLGETFQPAKHVFRPQVIRAWKQLQTMQNNG